MKTIDLLILGYGGVGRALVRRIIAARDAYAARADVHLSVVGLADSSGALLEARGFDAGRLAEFDALKQRGAHLPGASPALGADVLIGCRERTIVVDTSASTATLPTLLEAARRGLGVVLANKLPLAGDLAWFEALCEPRAGRVRWETTCGAALPVISTLNTLLDSGDAVARIEGVLSGTLAYVASQLEAGAPFGATVRTARQLGYTEPDPRQDLGGKDAARKGLILARMLGYRLALDQVDIEALYPPALDGLSVDEFLRAVDTLDAPMRALAETLTRGGRRLRFVVRVEAGRVSARLEGVDADGKLGTLQAGDNIVAFSTAQYAETPLAVSGRGAGHELTASGVLGDIVSLARQL